MSTSTKPSFILLPGAWCPATYYEKVTPKLESLGYETIALDLPSVGKKPDSPPASAYDDANFVRAKITELSNQGKDVIICANSYGNFVAFEASKGVSKADRQASGKPGGVVHLIVLDFLLAPIGKNVQEVIFPHIPVDGSKPVEDYLEPSMPVEVGGKFLFGSLSDEEQLHYGKMVQPHSAKSFTNPLTYAAYEHIPTTCVIGELDLALKPELQHESVDAAIAKGVGKIKKVVLQTDHIPMLAHPEEVVKVCEEAVHW
ncbi:alpha/beta-hydrolase [Lojkania enalia]|uniref:Alpha/beta-hydrolase n=1 Tax=Lojkania enalia TaxID=147567 RepID=A0A9P4NDJ3_9PLEO|nr:alpha/beta-hydrolase [Didymosphaeria enalia]